MRIFAHVKKEFGKWLMDIAKYMVTALLLSTIFADMNEPIIIYIVVILSMIVLGFGLYWVNEGNKENKKINSHKFEPKTMTSLSPCNTKQPEAQNFRLVFLVVAL